MPEPQLLSPEGVPGAVLDPTAVSEEDLTFAGAHGDSINGYLARPAKGRGEDRRGDDRHPGIVVIHDAGGAGEHLRDVTRRLANQGYVALGVDLYTREGGPPPAGDWEAIMQRLFSISDARILSDLEGAADLLHAREDVSGKIGCIGFCVGGRLTLLFACASNRLDAAIDCWGGFIDSATPQERSTPQRPTPPLDMIERLHCPLMAAIGAEDHNPSPALAKQLRARLRQTPHETSVDVYEGAGHAFFADYRPSYRPQPAARLWQRIVPFLDRHLKDA